MTRRQIFDRTIDVPLPDGLREDVGFSVRECQHCGLTVRHQWMFAGWKCLACGRVAASEFAAKGGA